MHHLFAKLAGTKYYICTMNSDDTAHIKGVAELYVHLYNKAEFEIKTCYIGPIEFAAYKSCLEFAKKYKASHFLHETVGG